MLRSKFKVFRDSRIAIDLTFSLRGEEYFKAGNLQFIVTLTRITFVVSLICPLYDQEDFGDVHFKAFHFMININSSRERKRLENHSLNMVIFAVRRSEGTHYKTKRVSFQCQWFVTFDFSFLFDSLLISR